MAVGTVTKADLTFTTGPETRVAQSTAVLTGRVSGYHQDVIAWSAPAGGVPLEWAVTGRLAEPRVLKGSPPPGPQAFERTERSLQIRPALTPSLWERSYGHLARDGKAVMFLGPGPDWQALTVVPTGDGEQDLAGLVADIVRFRALPGSKAKFDAWAGYLTQSKTTEGKCVALRALCYSKAGWQRLERPIGRLLLDHRTHPQVRKYAFAIVAYYVVREHWEDQTESAVDLLGEAFVREPDPDVTAQYLVSISVVQDYCHEEGRDEERRPINDQLCGYVKQRKRLAIKGSPPVDADQEDDYRETREEMLHGPPADAPNEEP